MKDTSTQTEFEDDIIPSNEAGSGPESSVAASNVDDGLELLAVPSTSSSGSSTPSSAETLCDPEIPAEDGSSLSEQTQATASATVDVSSSDARARNPNEKREIHQLIRLRVTGLIAGDEGQVFDRFMAKLLKVRKMIGSSAHTIIIARNILKSLERLVNL